MGAEQRSLGSSRRLHGHSGNSPGQGPFLDVTLVVVDGLVVEASYETYQCPGCHTCGKALCEFVVGRSVEVARRLDHAALAQRVGPLPKHRQICYALALLALDDALKQLEKQEGAEAPSCPESQQQ